MEDILDRDRGMEPRMRQNACLIIENNWGKGGYGGTASVAYHVT